MMLLLVIRMFTILLYVVYVIVLLSLSLNAFVICLYVVAVYM